MVCETQGCSSVIMVINLILCIETNAQNDVFNMSKIWLRNSLSITIRL